MSWLDAAQTDDVARRTDGRLGANREPARFAFVGDRGTRPRTADSHATAPSISDRIRSRSSGCTHVEVGGEGALEIERIHTVHAMELVAPLHRVGADIPQPASDMGERLPFPEALLDLGQGGLGEACLGEVLGHADRTDELAGVVDDGRDRQGDRHQHAVLALDLGEDPIDALTCRDTLERPTPDPARR